MQANVPSPNCVGLSNFVRRLHSQFAELEKPDFLSGRSSCIGTGRFEEANQLANAFFACFEAQASNLQQYRQFEGFYANVESEFEDANCKQGLEEAVTLRL